MFRQNSYVFESVPMRELLCLLERVSRTEASILITGETGTGKEIVARLTHERSARSRGPWIDFNCAAFPEHLIESELFGYEPGAFSGASRAKPGLFEQATGGSLFLDEAGELPPGMQAKLLRVLDGMPFLRLGGTRRIQPDARIIAATNRDIESEVAARRFRPDLYYRLSQVRIHIPPLRDRRDDIAPLARAFLGQVDGSLRFTREAERALEGRSWPGNVRELRNAVVAASLRAEGCEVGPEAFDGRYPGKAALPERTLATAEREMILQAIAATNGNRSEAARRVGISRRTLSRRLHEYVAASDEMDSENYPDLAALGRAIAEPGRAGAPPGCGIGPRGEGTVPAIVTRRSI